MAEEKILNVVLSSTAQRSMQKLEEPSSHGKKGGWRENEERGRKGNTHRSSVLVQSMTYLNSKSPSAH